MISQRVAYSTFESPAPYSLAGRQEEVPESLRLREGLQLLDDRKDLPRTKLFRLAVVSRLVRIDLLLHEGFEAGPQFARLL
jgi:hypothetical protein